MSCFPPEWIPSFDCSSAALYIPDLGTVVHLIFLHPVNRPEVQWETLLLKTNPRKGERGLAKAQVTVWIYEGSLRVEKEAVTLSQYEIELKDDHKHLKQVSNPRLSSTPFRSPQLTLIDLGPDSWLLYWKTPDQAPAHRKPREASLVQLPLFELPPLDLAVGDETRRGEPRPLTHLHLVGEPPEGQGTAE